MTTGEPQSDQDEKPASTPREGSLPKRILDWFWRGSALAKARQAYPEPGERATTFAQRAKASAELAQNMLASDEPGEIGSERSACEAYRQSSYWSLCAMLAKVDPVFQPDDSERVWGALDDALLLQAASDEKRVDVLRTALRSGSFVYFAELPPVEQQALLTELRKFAQALLLKLDERTRALDAIFMVRTWRLVLLAVVGLCLAMSPAVIKKVIEARSELAVGKPWRTSTKFGGGCNSPAQQCTENPGYFFHTNEEASPWVEFDLGMNRNISKVRVDNRIDCCTDRADPLVVEVSTDQKHWRKVSQHDGVFTTWEAQFPPVSARYLRVRLLKQNYLHLSGVRVY